MDFLILLDGISLWWWVALGVAIGAVEMVTFTYFLIWLALAAFAPAIGLWLMPGLSGAAQLTTFAVASIGFTGLGRLWLILRPAVPTDVPGLNRRAEQLIGRSGRALDRFESNEGVILVDDVRWRARLISGTAERDARLLVIDVDGMTLICEAA